MPTGGTIDVHVDTQYEFLRTTTVTDTINPLTGKPLEQRLRNFRPGADSAIRALGGPTLWMRRLRTIENEQERHETELGERWLALWKVFEIVE